MRGCARMCIEVMAMIVIVVVIEKGSCEEDVGFKLILLTYSPPALHLGSGNRQRSYLDCHGSDANLGKVATYAPRHQWMYWRGVGDGITNLRIHNFNTRWLTVDLVSVRTRKLYPLCLQIARYTGPSAGMDPKEKREISCACTGNRYIGHPTRNLITIPSEWLSKNIKSCSVKCARHESTVKNKQNIDLFILCFITRCI